MCQGGDRARDIWEVDVLGLGGALDHSDELGNHCDWAQVRFLKGKGTRSRHWFGEEMVGFVEWRPMGHYLGGPQAGTRSTIQESLACRDGLGEKG